MVEAIFDEIPENIPEGIPGVITKRISGETKTRIPRGISNGITLQNPGRILEGIVEESKKEAQLKSLKENSGGITEIILRGTLREISVKSLGKLPEKSLKETRQKSVKKSRVESRMQSRRQSRS